MAETGKMKTYSDALEALLDKSVILSPEFLEQVENFMKDGPKLGHTSREEFIQEAIRFRMTKPAQEK